MAAEPGKKKGAFKMLETERKEATRVVDFGTGSPRPWKQKTQSGKGKFSEASQGYTDVNTLG